MSTPAQGDDPLAHLRADQFEIVHQGETPLDYNRWGHIQRLGAVHPDLPVPKVRSHYGPQSTISQTEYYAPKANIRSARRKTPKVVTNPGAAAPGTGAFVDYTDQGNQSLYVNYASTRPDVRGRGLASKLINQLAEMHPEHHINFGKVMNPAIWKIKDRLAEQGRSVSGHRDF